MPSWRRARWLVIAGLVAAGSPALADDATGAIVASIDAERARLERPPMSVSPELTSLARALAEEMGADTSLEFEPIGGSELLSRARETGYAGVLVQMLTAVDDRSACEIVAEWNTRLPSSEVYRRPEAREIGVGLGFLQDLPLTVVLVGVPRSTDPIRKKWPGVAPREHLEADLFREVNEQRFRLGRPLFARSAELDGEAQETADELLGDAGRTGAGQISEKQSTILFYKGSEFQVADPRSAVDQWMHSQRSAFVLANEARVGVGLASRGRGGRLDAVWVLLMREASANQ